MPGKYGGIVTVVSDVTGTMSGVPDVHDPARRPPLSAGDRCDRCGAQAYVRIVLAGGGELLFCGHHFSEHELKLRGVAIEIDDERERAAAAPNR